MPYVFSICLSLSAQLLIESHLELISNYLPDRNCVFIANYYTYSLA